jgi:hypothetical protein
MVWLAPAFHPQRILDRALNGFLPKRRNRRILMLLLLLRVGILHFSMVMGLIRFFQDSISVLYRITTFLPINSRVLRLHASITAGVSFPADLSMQSIQIRTQLGRLGQLSFPVPTLYPWEPGLQSPPVEKPVRDPVVPVVCRISTIGPIVVRAQGVLRASGWDM